MLNECFNKSKNYDNQKIHIVIKTIIPVKKYNIII